MKTGKKVLIGIVVLAMLVTLLSNIGQVFDLGFKEETAYASIWNSNGTYKEGSITKTGTLGSASNPFMVLEIVPSYRQAQFGYLVGGQEPIDISAVSSMAESNTKTAIAADLTTWLTKSKTEAVFKDFSSSFSTEDWMNYQNNYFVEQSGSADRYAVYQHQASGTGGNYRLKLTQRVSEATSIEDSTRQYYLKVDETPHIYVYAFANKFGFRYNAELYCFEPQMYVYNWLDEESNITYGMQGGRYNLVTYVDDTYGYAYAEDGDHRDGYRYEFDSENNRYVKAKLKYIKFAQGDQEERVVRTWDTVYAGDYIDIKDSTCLSRNGYENIQDAMRAVAPGALVRLDDGSYYIKSDDSRLMNYMAEKDADGNPYKYYVVDYEYTLEEVTEGTGDYKLVYKNYQDSADIAANADERVKYTSNLVFTEEQYYAQGAESYIPDEIKARPTENVQVYTAYKWELKNNELFKKYALGLIYEDEKYAKGEDVSSYEFLGWYYEPECVNAFNETTAIKKNTTLYAKWAAHYTDATRDSNISVNFNANTTDPVDGFNFSNVIAKLRNGDKIVAPSGTPHRTG
ncbi:MAG: InlB B-repeat-containing protein, partial [Butyrivibrio sp.]|nr:InlB B-repeat-containing protein [Butyrivibrio sp.]